MEELTNRQKDILNVVKKFIAEHGYPPTVREIGKILDLRSPATIHFHLKKLTEKGYINKFSSKNRALELNVDNEYLNEKLNVIDIPLLGTITAGNPIEAIETPNEFFSVPAYLINSKKELFALNVHGESMINKGIYDNDVVIIEKGKDANNGEIVAAMTMENEVTLKTFYKEKDHIRLQPENDTMKPIILDNVNILGKAVGLYRKLK
ncbi:MAG: transcriptional repressor LexA [bacterium]|nr:transcriptional repressor LexA [bacterium]